MKRLLILLIFVFITGCVTKLDSLKPISDYKGSIIIERYSDANGELTDNVILKLQDGKVVKVELLEFDLDFYTLKDTIK